MATADIRSAGARQLSPKLTVKIESQVWSSSWTRIAAFAADRQCRLAGNPIDFPTTVIHDRLLMTPN